MTKSDGKENNFFNKASITTKQPFGKSERLFCYKLIFIRTDYFMA